MKESLKPNAYEQSEDVPFQRATAGAESDGVPFVE